MKLNTSKKILLATIMLFALFLLTNEKKSNAASYIWPVGGNNAGETYVEYTYGVRTYNSSTYDSKYNYSPYEQYYGNTENHYGIDITGIKGNSYSIVSVSSGTVVATSANRYYYAGTNFVDRNKRRSSSDGGGYGNYVIVQEASTGKCFLYAHLKAGTIKVKKGDTVSVGQVLGTMGSSGDSGHMHLHFEVRKSLSTTTINGGGSLVNTTGYNVQTEDPLKYITPPTQANLNRITYSYNSTKLNVYLNFDKEITVKTAPVLTITAGSETKTATYIGIDSTNKKLTYEINYNTFSNTTSGQMKVRCDNGGSVITKAESGLSVTCTFGNRNLITLETPAQLLNISYTRYSNSTKIYLNFDKEVTVKTAPKLNVTVGNETLVLDSAVLSYDKKKLAYTLSYDDLNMATSGDILVKCTNGGNVVTNSTLARPVSCTFNTKKTGTLASLKISNTYKTIVENNLGDVDQDGRINASDASIILTISSKLGVRKELTAQEKIYSSRADVNQDGAVNAIDASEVLSYYAYSAVYRQEDIKNAILCDFNNDNKVDSTDYSLLLNAVSKTNYSSTYDINKDGSVNSKDTELFLTTLKNIGKRS